MKLSTLGRIVSHDHYPIVRAVRLSDGYERLIIGPPPPDPLGEAVQKVLRDQAALVITLSTERWFLQPFLPPLELLVVGAVHIAQFLVRIANLTNYQVKVIDPRTSFAHKERFPGAQLITDWPDEVLSKLPLSGRSAIVTLSHDPKIDDAALSIALSSTAFYIGCLGSRRTHKERLSRLRQQGHSPDHLDRLRGPVGLAIGAKTPAEIAVAIMAEITQTLRLSCAQQKVSFDDGY
ncbi:MAG: XdhC family protein [Myxococcales bacterium]|nr:XdhC family protein [Myxococcales bacterium]